MAFDDIKKAIMDEAEEIAEQHKKAGREKEEELKKEWGKIIAERKNNLLVSAARKIEQKIQQVQFKRQNESQAEILKIKETILNNVYFSALKKLSDLNDAQYIKLMEKLIQNLPNEQGFLLSTEGKKNLLKKALDNSGKKHKLSQETVKISGGFIFESEKLEINQSFEALIEEAKDKTLTTITAIIFNNE